MLAHLKMMTAGGRALPSCPWLLNLLEAGTVQKWERWRSLLLPWLVRLCRTRGRLRGTCGGGSASCCRVATPQSLAILCLLFHLQSLMVCTSLASSLFGCYLNKRLNNFLLGIKKKKIKLGKPSFVKKKQDLLWNHFIKWRPSNGPDGPSDGPDGGAGDRRLRPG